MSDLKRPWMATWAQLKNWRGSAGLPILPPFAALVELSVLVALIVIADWAFPSLEFTALEPSPFWVPVLLLSLQYGTVAGLIAAAAATAAYVFNGVADQAVGENFFNYLLRIWALPILWIGVALVLGQFRLRQIAQKQQLRQDLAQRSDEARRLAIYSKELEGRCHRLERQLSTRASPPVKPVLDALVSIGSADPDVATALARVSQTLWPGAQVSASAVSTTGCAVVASSGWPATAAWATEITSAHPLHKAIAAERRAVSVLNRGDEVVLAGLGLAACPIFSADGERVTGMLKIELIDPQYLDHQTPAHLALLSHLLSPLLLAASGRQTAPVPQPAREGAHVTRLKSAWKSTNGATHAEADEAADIAKPDAHSGLRPRRSH